MKNRRTIMYIHPLISIFHKLNQANTKADVITSMIMNHYFHTKYCSVSFLYFLPLSTLFRAQKTYTQYQKKYLHALQQSDFILPDGVGLQFFRYWCMRSWIPECNQSLHNLNGTDFVPYFLHTIIQQYKHTHTCQIICYGGKQNVSEKIGKLFASQGREVLTSQNGYEDFDREKIPHNTPKSEKLIRVFLVARGSPLQEIWSMDHMQTLQKHNILIIHVGGLFDFLVGTEKRAPLFIRKIKGERIRRFFSAPSKNAKKVLKSFGVFWFVFKKLILKRPLF